MATLPLSTTRRPTLFNVSLSQGLQPKMSCWGHLTACIVSIALTLGSPTLQACRSFILGQACYSGTT